MIFANSPACSGVPKAKWCAQGHPGPEIVHNLFVSRFKNVKVQSRQRSKRKMIGQALKVRRAVGGES